MYVYQKLPTYPPELIRDSLPEGGWKFLIQIHSSPSNSLSEKESTDLQSMSLATRSTDAVTPILTDKLLTPLWRTVELNVTLVGLPDIACAKSKCPSR